MDVQEKFITLVKEILEKRAKQNDYNRLYNQFMITKNNWLMLIYKNNYF